MKVDTRAIVVGAAAALGAFFMFRGGGSDAPADPSSAIPKESFLAASIDLAELRRSPVYDAIFGKEGLTSGSLLRVGAIATACGFDPIARIERLVVAVPEEGESGEIGLAAKVELSRDEIERCSSGISSEKTEPKRVGSFGVVEARGSGSERPRVAYGKGGLLVAGRGKWFDAMLGAAEGTRATLAEAKEHASIRSSLTKRAGWSAPAILASALLPADLRERLRREMRAELGSGDASSEAMGGVLGVSGVGLAVRLGPRIEAAVELVCDSRDACTAVDKLVQKKRLDLSKDLSLRMIGLGTVLDSIETSREDDGTRERVTAGADARQLADTVERILRFRARRERDQGQAPPRSAPPPSPDETLRAGDAGRDAR